METDRLDYDALTERLRHQLGVIHAAGIEVSTEARILDLGCGQGNSVKALRAAGFDAWGCDISLRDSPVSHELIAAGFVRKISASPYRLPFDDEEFDLILSDEVLEHVMNYQEFITENRRVQKRGGVSVHIFPGPWTPIEMHTFVPLASVHRSYPWLLLWAALGIRNEFQEGLSAREVAKRNFRYLRDHTNYVRTSDVRRMFGRHFKEVTFREDLFLRLSTSRRARLLRGVIAAMPFLIPVYRTMWNRVLIVRC